MKFNNPFKKKRNLDHEVKALTAETKKQNIEPQEKVSLKERILQRIQQRVHRKPKKKVPGEESFKEQMHTNRKFKKQKKKRLSTQQQRRNLEDYLNKAGYPDVQVEKLKQRIFRIAVNVSLLVWIVPIVTAIINKVAWGKFILWMLSYSVGVVFMGGLFWLILWGIIYFYLELKIYYRTKELEEVLPDFLQLTSSNISAGMPIDRALWLAIRPNFGVLAKEIEDVAKATLSGEDLSDSLKHFANRYESNLLKRSISILLEGLDAGGELADLLNKIALNIQEIKIMKKEMAANVTTYAIFISFSSIIIAPVLFALASQLVAIIIAITSGIDLSGSSSSMAITVTANPALIGDFKIYSYFMLAVTAGMSAAIISVIRNGNIKDGIRNIPIYIVVALVIYTLASSFFSGIFSGFF